MPQPHSEADYTLGKTGQTVIYIFPDGDALMERDKQSVSSKMDLIQADKSTVIEPVPIDPVVWIQQLVSQGKLTAAQAMVIQHDHQTTGIDWEEAIQARGWMIAEID